MSGSAKQASYGEGFCIRSRRGLVLMGLRNEARKAEHLTA